MTCFGTSHMDWLARNWKLKRLTDEDRAIFLRNTGRNRFADSTAEAYDRLSFHRMHASIEMDAVDGNRMFSLAYHSSRASAP